MKKTISVLFFALLVAITSEVNAQTGCTEYPSSTTSSCVPPSLPEPGLDPADDSLDCLITGQSANVTINFKNFDTISGVTVEWLRLDSLTNLPCGLSFALNQAPGHQYLSAENGCMSLAGTVTSGAGIYKLGIYVTIKVSILPNPVSGEAGALSAQFGGPPFDYYVRVKANAGDACPDIPTGIRDLPNVTGFSITPNPVKSVADVKFSLENPMDVKVVIYNAVGQQVYGSDVRGNAGENKVTIDRSNLNAGVYLLGIEQNGRSLISKQLVLE
jgi:hypothetical protein